MFFIYNAADIEYQAQDSDFSKWHIRRSAKSDNICNVGGLNTPRFEILSKNKWTFIPVIYIFFILHIRDPPEICFYFETHINKINELSNSYAHIANLITYFCNDLLTMNYTYFLEDVHYYVMEKKMCTLTKPANSKQSNSIQKKNVFASEH